MKNNRGITLIILVITIIILAIIGGVIVSTTGDTYESSQIAKFSSSMKMIQKKVDLYLEEGTDISTLGKELNTEQKSKLQTILDSDTRDVIQTTDANSDKIRYFDTEGIYLFFEIVDLNDEIVVNFENREVISLKGINVDGNMYYVLKGL